VGTLKRRPWSANKHGWGQRVILYQQPGSLCSRFPRKVDEKKSEYSARLCCLSSHSQLMGLMATSASGPVAHRALGTYAYRRSLSSSCSCGLVITCTYTSLWIKFPLLDSRRKQIRREREYSTPMACIPGATGSPSREYVHTVRS